MNSAEFKGSAKTSPDYDSLLQNLLDLLVSQSQIILAAGYQEYESSGLRFYLQAVSVSKSAPRRYRTMHMMARRTDAYTPAGEGYLRDQIIEDGITRLVLGGLEIAKVYRLGNGGLTVDRSAYPPQRDALKDAGVASYLLISTHVPTSEDVPLHTGIVSLIMRSDLSDTDAEEHVAVFENCERLVHSDENRKVFEGLAAPQRAGTREQGDVRSKAWWWQRRQALFIMVLTLALTVPAVWFGVTYGLPLVVEINPNAVAVIAVLADITATTVLWAISERRRR